MEFVYLLNGSDRGDVDKPFRVEMHRSAQRAGQFFVIFVVYNAKPFYLTWHELKRLLHCEKRPSTVRAISRSSSFWLSTLEDTRQNEW